MAPRICPYIPTSNFSPRLPPSQARNILLKSGASDTGRPFTAKVADFGLSLRIDPGDTHVSNMFQGTMTHMVRAHGHMAHERVLLPCLACPMRLHP